MDRALNKFLEAHDRYLSLDASRTQCDNPKQSEMLHIELMKAYLEVQFYANHFVGIQFAEGSDYTVMN